MCICLIHLTKPLGIFDLYSEDVNIRYSGLGRFIMEFPNELAKFSSKNLLSIMANIPRRENENIEKIENIIMQRLKNEDFKCDSLDNEIFLKSIFSNNLILSKFKKENQEIIKNNIKERLEKAKKQIAKKLQIKLNMYVMKLTS